MAKIVEHLPVLVYRSYKYPPKNMAHSPISKGGKRSTGWQITDICRTGNYCQRTFQNCSQSPDPGIQIATHKARNKINDVQGIISD